MRFRRRRSLIGLGIGLLIIGFVGLFSSHILCGFLFILLGVGAISLKMFLRKRVRKGSVIRGNSQLTTKREKPSKQKKVQGFQRSPRKTDVGGKRCPTCQGEMEFVDKEKCWYCEKCDVKTF